MLLALDLLATLPGYQRRGIGSAMLRWGLEKADQSLCRVYLEATIAGYPMYIKHGFKAVEEIAVDRASYGGTGIETFWIMIRDPMPVG